MKKSILLALVGALLAAGVRAQLPKSETGPIPSLAELIPENVLGYYKLVDPVGDFERLMGDGDVWKSPQQMSKKTRRATERGLKEGDRELNLQDGSLDSWLKSIGTVEFALFTLNFGEDSGFDEPPLPDFAVIMESPLAIEIYNQVAQMMIENGIGSRTEAGSMVLGVQEGFAPVFAIYGSKVVLASDQGRLDAILKAAKTGTPNSLAASANFRAVCGDSRGPRVGYMRFAALLDIIRGRFSENRQKRFDDVVRPLGLTKVTAIGYREDGPNGILSFKGDEPVKIFQLLKGKVGAPNLQGLLPAETAFSFTHTTDAGPHLRRIEAFLTDQAAFPFAAVVGAGLAAMTLKTGLTTEAMLEPMKDGFVIGLLPDEHGRMREADGAVVVANLPVAEEAEKFLDRLKKAYAKANNCEVEEVVEDGVRYVREKAGSRLGVVEEEEEGVRTTAAAPASRAAPPVPAPVSEPATPIPPANDDEPESDSDAVEVVGIEVGTESAPTVTRRRVARLQTNRAFEAPSPFVAAYNGKLVVLGRADYVKRVLKAQAGQGATLATTGAYQRLPQKATFFTTLSLKAIFGQGSEFGPAFSFLKDFGAIGAAAVAEDDRLTVTFNRAPGQFFNLMMGAGAAGADGREETEKVREALNDIGSKTRAYKEKNKAWPKSLADLGYEAGKAPSFADESGKQKPIVFLPPKGEAQNSWDSLLAYWECSDYGRLACNLDGYASVWSESRFLTGLARYNAPK